MSTAEELQEHAEHAHHPFDKRVAATMAMIAAALAVVSVAGHIKTTEELLKQQESSDTWAQYQAKSIRRYDSEIARDIFAALDRAEQAKRYTDKMEGYAKDNEKIKKDAEAFKKESELSGKQAWWFHLGEIFLEIALVFASLAILTKRPLLYWTAVASSSVGIVLACLAFTAHA
jgi:hypothetical protein